jgi:hypothetical protein
MWENPIQQDEAWVRIAGLWRGYSWNKCYYKLISSDCGYYSQRQKIICNNIDSSEQIWNEQAIFCTNVERESANVQRSCEVKLIRVIIMALLKIWLQWQWTMVCEACQK